MRHSIHTGLRATAASGALLALAACGNDSTDNGDGEVQELTVLHAPINYEAVYVAEREGYFEEVGLEVDIRPGGTAQDNLGQLAGGSVDLSIISWDAAVSATQEGVPIKVISSNAVISEEFDTSGVFVREDSDIESMGDLEGRTIAFNSVGSGGNVPVLQALEADGVDADSVTQVSLPFASMEAALENDQVEAVFPSDSYFHQISANDDYRSISHPSREFRGGLPITLWAGTEEWLEENPDTAEQFNEAMTRAIEFYEDADNREAILEIRSEVSEQEIDEVDWEFIPFNISVDTEVAQRTTEALDEFGIVDDPKSVDDILWEGAPRH
ncbi:ABC transporter substrate-binding protein [Nesterenkonia muleiensis]|uniref:ABC transporter substrate-binding protein n=1 Tax=Nesterenkonia muleiensis TaxID=2282648 RepID=UPI000E7325C3|nr:ABC transporter substrate-binding protein [Nesterenkonia muleiensis]